MITAEAIFMLHNEARHLIVQALKRQIPVKEIAKCFSVNTSTIYRLQEQWNAASSVETRLSLRGRKRPLPADDICCIDRLIQQHPDITIHEVTDTLQLRASDETVRKAIVKLGHPPQHPTDHLIPLGRRAPLREVHQL